jgi:SAM-dependent methyltransferase
MESCREETAMSDHQAKTFEKAYARRFHDDSPRKQQWRRDLWQVLVDEYFSRFIPADAAVVDFGCGAGEFINAVKARRRVAVDLRDSVTEHLVPGVEFERSADGWPARVGEGSADVVFCSNLLEHLPDRRTLLAVFEDFRRVLGPRGRLLVLGPNLRYTGAAYWDFFDHVLPLTHLSLAEALQVAGFEVEELVPRFLPYTAVGKRSLTPLSLVRWYLRLPVLWKLLGAQFFAVARPAAEALDRAE